MIPPELQELVDAFVSGELDEEGRARLEALLASDPALVHALADHFRTDAALRVLLGDAAQDDRVVQSVLGDLGGKPPEQFRAELMARVRADRRGASRRPLRWVAAAAAAIALAALAFQLLRPRVETPLRESVKTDVRDPAPRVPPLPPETPAVRSAEVALVLVRGDVFVVASSPAVRNRARAGQELAPGAALVTDRGAFAVVEYADTTRLEIGPETSIRGFSSASGKRVGIERGLLTADVVRQPAGAPLEVSTPQADARVLGTRFQLSAAADATRLQVEEGRVGFTHRGERKSIDVASGFYAVAAPGVPFEALPVAGGRRFLEVDPAFAEGDGGWVVEGRAVRQTRAGGDPAARPSSFLFEVAADRGLLLEATVRLDRVPAEGPWGFGLLAATAGREVALRTHQGLPAGPVIELAGVNALPFEHGRAGTYHVKLRIERRRDAPALLRGRIWQGDREPDGWMIENEAALEGPALRVGLQSIRSACTFTRFRVEVLRDEGR